MTNSLAQALSKIDDVEAIQHLLDSAHGGEDFSTNLNNANQQPTLEEFFDRYYNRRQNRSPATRAQYKRTIPVFIDFASANGVKRSAQISTELVDGFVHELQATYETDATIHTYTKNVRAWLRWLHKRQLCPKSVHTILGKEEIGLQPKARDEAIPASVANHILTNLRSKRRGSQHHALLELLWNGGPRLGGVHSLDLLDFDKSNTEIRLRHRPDTGTRLKNGNSKDEQPGDGERNVEISDAVIDAISHYIKFERPNQTDRFGRDPLFATQRGRAAKSTLRRWVYEATSCRWSPESANEENCNGNCDPDTDVCPCSYYPHAIRRGAIVHHLSGGLRPDYASGRFDVSTKIIKLHYDPRTKRQRKDDRSQLVRDSW